MWSSASSTEVLLAVLSITSALQQTVAAKPRNAILLSNVESLTLRSTSLTTSRRVPPIPQLKCISNPQLCSHLPFSIHTTSTFPASSSSSHTKHSASTARPANKNLPPLIMRCTNNGAGYDAQDIQWSCSASLPPEFKLGGTDVICEGYDSAEDEYILRGSCGVEFRVVLTEEGERKWPELAGGGSGKGWASWLFGDGETKASTQYAQEEEGNGKGLWIFLGFVAVVFLLAYNFGGQQDGVAGGRARRRPFGGFGGGGGGFDDNDDPPPPYPGSGSGRRSYTKPSTRASRSTGTSSSSGAAGGYQPGFWTGLAGGAAAGYFAGNRNRGSQNQVPYGGGYNNRNQGGGWFGGGGGTNRNTYGEAGPSGPSSSSAASSSRYESTGFGSTSRR